MKYPRYRPSEQEAIQAFLSVKPATILRPGRAYGSNSSTAQTAILSKRQKQDAIRKRRNSG